MHAWPHTPKMMLLLWRNLQHLSAGKKSTSILHVFVEILQRYCKLAYFGTLGMCGYVHPKWYYYLVENFCVYLQAKNQLHPPWFYGDIADMQTFFGYFGHAWLHSPKIIKSEEDFKKTWMHGDFLWKTSMHSKNKLHHSLLS